MIKLFLVVAIALFMSMTARAELIFEGYNESSSGPVAPAFSPDGTLLAVATDYEIHLRQAPGYEIVRRIAMPNGRVTSIGFTPDGRLLVGDINGALAVFKPGSSQPDQILALNLPVEVLAISPSGRQLAVAGRLGEVSRIAILDATNITLRFYLEKLPAEQLLFVGEDQLLAVKSEPGADRLRSIDLKQRKLTSTRVYPAGLYSMAYNQQDNLLYAGGSPHLLLLDAASQREIRRFQDPVRPNSIRAVAWHAAKRLLVTAENEGPLSLRDPSGTILKRLYGHLHEPVYCVISPDGSTIASLTNNGRDLRIWNSSDFLAPPRYPRQLASIPDSLREQSQNHQGLSWKRSSDMLSVKLQGSAAQTVRTAVRGIKLAQRNDQLICVAGSSLTEKLHRIEAIEIRAAANLELLLARSREQVGRRQETAKPLELRCVDADTAILLTTNNCTIFSRQSAQEAVFLQRYNVPLAAVALSPDGSRLALGDRNGMVRIFDRSSNRLKQVVFTERPYPGLKRLAFSAANRLDAELDDRSYYRWELE
mgnify:CR=1 FL=1